MQSELLSAASLLLGIMGLLYGFWYKDIVDEAEKAIPQHSANCLKPRKDAGRVLAYRCIPLVTASWAIFLVFLPDMVLTVVSSCAVYSSRTFAFSDYSAVETAFCLVEVFLLALAIGVSSVSLRLLLHYLSLKMKEHAG